MIFVSFNNMDPDGFVRLNTVGTIKDLALQSIQLGKGCIWLSPTET